MSRCHIPLVVISMTLCASCFDNSDQQEETVTPIKIDIAPQSQPGVAKSKAEREPEISPALFHVKIIKRHPHARDAFTQGLLMHEGQLYESTGQYGQSSLRKVALKTGKVLKKATVERTYFAEGLARVGDRLIQLTWREGRALLWSLSDFRSLGELSYQGEGWGLCFDGTHMVMSDGSDMLTFRDPKTFKSIRRIHVKKRGRKLERLNELECVDGSIYANIWQSPEIVKIDIESGNVLQSINAGGLLTRKERVGTDVLNGIAYIKETGRFLITGKNWPWVFEVEFKETASE